MMKADHCRHMFSNLVVFKKVGNVGGKDAQLVSIHLLNPCSFQISRLAQIRTIKFRQASYIYALIVTELPMLCRTSRIVCESNNTVIWS